MRCIHESDAEFAAFKVMYAEVYPWHPSDAWQNIDWPEPAHVRSLIAGEIDPVGGREEAALRRYQDAVG